jgi:hypothetical protein
MVTMTGEEVFEARATLGMMWGRGRPLGPDELGRALGLTARNAGDTVHAWERGRKPVSGPAAVAIAAMLAGYRPPHTDSANFWGGRKPPAD